MQLKRVEKFSWEEQGYAVAICNSLPGFNRRAWNGWALKLYLQTAADTNYWFYRKGPP